MGTRYQLYTKSDNTKIISDGGITCALNEIVNVLNKGNGIKEVSYNEKEHATEIRFEGYYCDFSLFLKEV